MQILITGCLHGAWDLLLDTLEELNLKQHIDLVIVSGDAETFRNEEDMKSFAAPLKYHILGSFYKIYNGERVPPCPIIVIGGNHEASDLFHHLPFGGWICPNVFYTGRAAQIMFGDVSITGISGLYKSTNYYTPVKEKYPLREISDIHTCYAMRAFTDFQLFGLKSSQIIVSHEWPSGIPSQYGGVYLQKRRRDLVSEDKNGTFGLPLGLILASKLRPSTWFAAHHHILFRADINDDTQFIALPKPLPGRDNWFVVADVEGTSGDLRYSGRWLSILKATAPFMEDPMLLEGKDWAALWAEMEPNLEAMEDEEPLSFTEDPAEYTRMFCEKYGIYNPNPELREPIMEEGEGHETEE